MDRIKGIRRGVIDRCTNPKNKHYETYGGRGIKVCEEWLNSQDAFVKWALENGYDDYLSLDRINANGDYEPCNCRWATTLMQAENKRTSSKKDTRKYHIQGRDYSLKMLARDNHLDYGKLRENVDKCSLIFEAMEKAKDYSFWGRGKNVYFDNKNQKEKLFQTLDANDRRAYSSLYSSCMANDEDIYKVLDSLIKDIERSRR